MFRSIFVLCEPGYTLIFYYRPRSVVPIFDTDPDPRAKRKRVKRSVTQKKAPLLLCFTTDLCAGDVVRLLGGLNVKKVSFVGHAMGGRVGMYTALHR